MASSNLYKVILIVFFLVLDFYCISSSKGLKCYESSLSGGIKEDSYLVEGKNNSVVDVSTGNPVVNAEVSIPSKNIRTFTDKNGNFSFNADLSDSAILAVKAKGYKPFSLTVNHDIMNNPLTLGISKSGREIVIDSNLHHLGDNNYSSTSANFDDFKARAENPVFKKNFYVGNISNASSLSLKIGSVIGIDTPVAIKLGQSRSRSYSTPVRIFLNDKKIGEIKINGDNQEILISRQLINFNSYNKIEIVTGKNLKPRFSVDYDDMEFLNLILEVR